jgi:hypothetical protein
VKPNSLRNHYAVHLIVYEEGTSFFIALSLKLQMLLALFQFMLQPFEVAT